MMRLLIGAALFAACWSCQAAAQESQADVSAAVAAPVDQADQTAGRQEDLYRAALRALAEGRLEDASALLQRVIAAEPRHAGAWLDLAISQCELGNTAEAERLFSSLQQRFDLPAAIAETIGRYRATGCGTPLPRQGGAWLLAATRGHDDNVNQGANDSRFTIGTGSAQTEYELDAAFLPKADDFSQLTAAYVRPLGSGGTNLIVQAYSRWHEEERSQDTVSMLGALEHTWTPGGWRLRGTGALGYVTLDRSLYQRQQQVQLRATPAWKMPANTEFAFSGNLSRIEYPTRPAYDSTMAEFGGIFGYRGKRSLAQATLTRLHDDSTDGRPGGDRKGWFGSLQWVGEATGRLALEGGLSWQHWRSSALYSPGLIETRRRQNTATLRTAANWQLRQHYSVVLEWRATLNRENIALFQYNSHALQLSLRWDNF
ncbi:tetratricopeptide repeat protein [Massilia sp.]|uniref:tetratricopeptide repeat protein n=1 Tax=Massilia sp. TaxID=1882437 RepID=UPI0028A160CA|nr:tetratricopeptide repeat protein [Massilia sp.]